MASGGFEELAVGGEPARLYASGAGNATPRVVVFHPWWGLNDDVIAYADRLAGAGLRSRGAGPGPGSRRVDHRGG